MISFSSSLHNTGLLVIEFCLCGLIVLVRVVPRRTVVMTHQSHVNCVSSVYGMCMLMLFNNYSTAVPLEIMPDAIGQMVGFGSM